MKEAFVSLKLQRQQSKDRDPAGLPQHHLLRPRRLRHPGRGPGLLRQGRQGPHRPGGRRAGLDPELARRPSTRPAGRTTGSGCSAATSTSSTAWPRWATSTAAAGRARRRAGCRSSRRSRAAGPVRRPAGPHADDGASQQLLARASPSQEISGGGLKVTTTFTRNAMDAAGPGGRASSGRAGLKELHVAVASVDPRPARCKGMYAGQDYLKQPDQLGRRAVGSPGSAFKPFALAAGIEDGYSLKSTFQGNSPYVFPERRRGRQRGRRATATTTAPAISLTTATEQSVNTAFVDLTAVDGRRPAEDPGHGRRAGRPEHAPGPRAGPRHLARARPSISPIDMANAYGTIADGGRAKKWFVINKVTDQRRHPAVRRAEADHAGAARRHRPRRQLRAAAGRQATAPARNALALGRPGRRQDRHRDQRRRQRLVVVVRRATPRSCPPR